MQLAAGRAADYPADALSIYRARITPLVALTDNAAYARAIELLHKVRKRLRRLGREMEFAAYLAALRIEYKRKRNFIKQLDALA